MTVTVQPVAVDRRSAHRRSSPAHSRRPKQAFLRHRPRHRRRAAPTVQVAAARYPLRLVALPLTGRNKGLGGRDYRAWGILIAALAWIGLVAGHAAGMPQATAVFAAIDALTWGQALAVVVPTEDAVEYSVVSVATSASILVLIGTLVVELRLTGAFFWIFLGMGAAFLAIQVVALTVQIVTYRVRVRPPQRVPSIVDGRIVVEQRRQ